MQDEVVCGIPAPRPDEDASRWVQRASDVKGMGRVTRMHPLSKQPAQERLAG